MKLKSDNDINHPIWDLATSVAETEDLISVLDSDVTKLEVMVLMLQEENAQLLQRVAALEATDTFTNNTLDGIIIVVGNVLRCVECSSELWPIWI